MAVMARAATTSDVFNAIAEPQRRDILVLLRAGERPVTELARELGMTQPGASKHLRVLREVGLVRDRRAGKQRLYALDARGLRPVHEWTGGFERFWNESFDRLDAYVQTLEQARQEEGGWQRQDGARRRSQRRPAARSSSPGSSTRHGSWCSRRSPRCGTCRGGGGRRDSPPRRGRSRSASAGGGASGCPARTGRGTR